ncbi:MAG: hypothetical protein IIT53_14020, partial [Fibrobacter sp.]|nr:hypothetical protein [Fibrobacter sp.]
AKFASVARFTRFQTFIPNSLKIQSNKTLLDPSAFGVRMTINNVILRNNVTKNPVMSRTGWGKAPTPWLGYKNE